MNKIKQLSPHWRKVQLALGLIIALLVLGSGCKQSEPIDTNEYYVKYEVMSSSRYVGGTLSVVLKSEDNQNKTFVINTRLPWETTIGPVKKGFGAYLRVSEIETNYGNLKLSSQISVSKNLSPFALKQADNTNVPRTSVQIYYMIDY